MRIEIFDILRGISLCSMIIFHAHYMGIHLFELELIIFSEATWKVFGFLIGMSFITLSGYVNSYGYNQHSFRENIKRGLKRAGYLGFVAALISFVTYAFFYEQRISWGIIHFFVLASLVQPFFSKCSWWIFPSIAITFLISYSITDVIVQTWYFIPFGIHPITYFSADYYPFLPWFGYILIGQALQLLFSKFGLEKLITGKRFPRFILLRAIGKHSLLVYVIHTPVLYMLFSSILWVLS